MFEVNEPPCFSRDALLTTIQGRHVADRYRLRMHRARSVVLTQSELVEIRAAQRTFEGAYMRTAIGQFSFALIVLKIFTAEFYSIGALFAVYGAGILFISLFRRQQGNKQFFSEVGEDGLHRKKFRTSGNVVTVLTALSISAYICLLVLTLRLET
ncbi:Nn.00g079280.m01.CDS01 [Neocucurbitaria sp. VM-36]